MMEEQEDLKNRMPTERKSVWRTPEERRMSDLTRVLEWLERRQGKKRQEVGTAGEWWGHSLEDWGELSQISCNREENGSLLGQGCVPRAQGSMIIIILLIVKAMKHIPLPGESTAHSPPSIRTAHWSGKTGSKAKTFLDATSSHPKPDHSVPHGKQGLLSRSKPPTKVPKKEEEHLALPPKSYMLEGKKRRLSSISGINVKEPPRKSELDIKDVIALETNQRPFRQQSIVEPMLQDILFSQRRSTLFREWAGKTSEALYERRLKSLIEKTPEPKAEASKMLRPEEVLSCRYLRLSKNNVRTLLKLCKDAGMNVDIHPHMVEGEIDGRKVFGHNQSITL
ncbi:uncharacterized protein C16orf78 homolog [Sorex fumeus]|uniref:uncharacterized protein C16orf78 homolog n=1 Tax=Sorex fumeus TaxID=62283 RepID=UPI0024AC99BA|nr:uncharacterized protein C16orf78 homolog [Sorex fumeus]